MGKGVIKEQKWASKFGCDQFTLKWQLTPWSKRTLEGGLSMVSQVLPRPPAEHGQDLVGSVGLGGALPVGTPWLWAAPQPAPPALPMGPPGRPGGSGTRACGERGRGTLACF